MSVLMIGLDGATFDLLDDLVARGIMPFFGSLVKKGARADLMSTRNPLTPPAWTSMITGRSPEAHGIYDFLRPVILEDGGIFLKVNDFRENQCETLWSMVNRGGLRATSLNFYGMSPPPQIEGVIVSGFVPWKHLRQATHPRGLFDEIAAIPAFDYRNLGMDIGEEKKCVQGLIEGEHEDWIALQDTRDTAWSELACHLMERDRTELTAVVLDGPDKIQHLFWRFVDAAYNDDSDAWYKHIQARCFDYYRQLDSNIERLVRTAGPETNVLFTSDHGFGPTTEVVYLNEWLSRKGYLTWSEGTGAGGSGKLTAERIKDHLGMVDWKNTLAFCPTPSSNSVFVKRDLGSGHGVRDEDYMEFCLKMRQELLDYRDPNTGTPVFVGVDANKMRGTAFAGTCPDLTVRLRDGGFVSILKSSEVVAPRKHPDGTHRPRGIFVGHGPAFRAGARVDALNIVDVTPLILALFGLKVPAELEGRVPHEIMQTAGEATTALEARPDVAVLEGEDNEPTAEEREALMKQLRVLGYMD